jgi:hypothetical protein
MLSFNGFRGPDCILKPDVFLYYVDPKEAVFIEVDEGVQPWRSQQGSFYKIAQHRCARRIITMPLQTFVEIAKVLPDPGEKLKFVHFISRSGSTLLMQMFEATGKCVTFAEPDELSQTFAMFPRNLSDARRLEISQAVGRFMCKTDSNDSGRYLHFIAKIPGKFHLWERSNGNFKLFCEAFPSSKHLFLYRDLHPTLYSCCSTLSKLPLLSALHFFVPDAARIRLTEKTHIDQFPFPSEQSRAAAKKVAKRYKEPLLLTSTIFRCVQLFFLVKQFKVPAINYEDIVRNPSFNLAVIFDHFGVTKDLIPQGLTALKKDSQAHTPVSRSQRSSSFDYFKDLSSIPRETKQCIDDMCELFQLPKIEDEQRLPGTITTP